MAGSWELKQRTSVLCSILHVDYTTIAWSLGLRNLQVPGHVVGLSGMPYDHARNTACMRVLDGGYEWGFFLDSDVIPPPDAILRLISHGQPIISGIYHRRSPPHGIPVMMKPVGTWITNYPANTVIEVDVVGAGCLLIHRSVLERLPPQRDGKHWFDWRVDLRGILPQHECLSEDFTFCMHAKKSGYRILVDTGVQCLHVGHAQASYNKLEPLGV